MLKKVCLLMLVYALAAVECVDQNIGEQNIGGLVQTAQIVADGGEQNI